ncbi:LPXTG cell wall anchor domain-containing protein [Bacillus pseudomycoides]|uniref:LPXTG cell wall anchor domain-containing protein n=1 Tax=Bacillus bingmayongensis TaxID=1150157 RepID=A0ABU5JQJ5_9BACI|nr:LPXTG cell wall anchor domain-containing protein [Bacillus pseudomycoides]
MKKKLLPICAMALLSVGYSSVASASTGTMTKEEAAQVQQDTAKKEAAIKAQQKSEVEKKGTAAQAQEKQAMAKKEEAIKAQQKNELEKKEVAKQAVKGEKLPNTASNSIAMMALSACLVALGSLFGFTRRKIKA